MCFFHSWLAGRYFRQFQTVPALTLLLIACLEQAPTTAYAWGDGGHAAQTRLIFENLPADIRTNFSKATLATAIQTWSLEPDGYKKPFTLTAMGQPAFDKLRRYGLSTRYDLHSDKGRALAFSLLVDAFSESNYDHVAFWTAVLSHSNGDMGAENHNPVAQYVSYAWDPFDIQLAQGGAIKGVSPLLDLEWTAHDPEGLKTVQRWVQGHLLADDNRDAQAALLDEMLRGRSGSAMLAGIGISLLSDSSAWISTHAPADRQRVWDCMGHLAGWGVVNVVRDVVVAKRLAATGAVLDVQAAIKAYTLAKQQQTRLYALTNDAMFAPLLRPASENPAIGIVFEPTWQMDEAMLGYSDRVIVAATARAFSQAGRRYLTLDIRAVLAEGLPAPSRMPVLIVSGSQLRDYEWMLKSDLDRRLKAYLEQGGKVIWIGGYAALPPISLGHLEKAMTRSAGAWPFSADEFASAELALNSPQRLAWPVVHNVATTGGWQKPVAPFLFSNCQSVGLEPLLTLHLKNKAEVVVGVTSTNAAYLPLYALAPFVFSQDRIADAGQPILDQVGQAILAEALVKLHLPDFTQSHP